MKHTPGPQRSCLTPGCHRKAVEQSPSKVFCAPCSAAIARGKRTERRLSAAPDLLEAAKKASIDFEEHQIIFRNRGDTMRSAECRDQIERLEAAIAKTRPPCPVCGAPEDIHDSNCMTVNP